jgi:hypothetical protein
MPAVMLKIHVLWDDKPCGLVNKFFRNVGSFFHIPKHPRPWWTGTKCFTCFTSEKQKATILLTQGQKLTLLSTDHTLPSNRCLTFFFLRPQIFLRNCICLFNILLDLVRCEASKMLLVKLQLFWYVTQRQAVISYNV